MLKVDYQRIGEKPQTVIFENESDRKSFLNGETAYDINEYWVELNGAKVLKIYED